MTDLPKSNHIYNHEEVVIDLSTSCTKDRAVMRMLGLQNMSTHKRLIPIAEDGVSLVELTLMYMEKMTLEERCASLAEQARTALVEAYNEDDSNYVEINRLDDEAEKIRQLTSRVREFLMDIDDELAKGSDSALRVDIDKTNSSGITHINIRSLDKWIAARSGAASVEAPSAHHILATAVQSKIKAKHGTRMPDQEEAIVRTIQALGYDPTSFPPNKSGKADVKDEVRKALAHDPLFKTVNVFNTAWDRCRKDEKIINVPKPI